MMSDVGWCRLDYNVAPNGFRRRVNEVLERPDDFESTFQTFQLGLCESALSHSRCSDSAARIDRC